MWIDQMKLQLNDLRKKKNMFSIDNELLYCLSGFAKLIKWILNELKIILNKVNSGNG